MSKKINIFLTDKEISGIFSIPYVTFNRWKKIESKQLLYIFLKNHKRNDFDYYLNKEGFEKITNTEISKLLNISKQTLSIWKKDSKDSWRYKLYKFLKKHNKDDFKKFTTLESNFDIVSLTYPPRLKTHQP